MKQKENKWSFYSRCILNQGPEGHSPSTQLKLTFITERNFGRYEEVKTDTSVSTITAVKVC